MAIEAWLAFRNGHGLDLEKALAAFDMFVLHDKRGDFIEVNLNDLCRGYTANYCSRFPRTSMV